MKDISIVIVETKLHAERVSKIVELLVEYSNAKNYKFEYNIKTLKDLALLHDIGKFLVIPSILTKFAPLSVDEWEEVKKHSLHSYEMLVNAGLPYKQSHIVMCHHERLNGKGYPHGITDIPIEAQIISVADVYDALTNSRIYRKFAYSHEKAIEIMRKDDGLNQDFVNMLNIIFVHKKIERKEIMVV